MTSGGKRKGAGRPAKTDARTKTLRVRLTEGEMRAIDAEAERLNKLADKTHIRAKFTRTDVIRRVLTRYLTGEWTHGD